MKIPSKKPLPYNTRLSPKCPNEIVVEITGQCNQKCAHCTHAVKNPKNLAFTTVKKIIDDILRNKIQAIRFTGGEPLLNPDFIRMITYAKDHGLYVVLNTNATLITPTFIKNVQGRIDNVLVSLHGFDNSSDQRLSGTKSSFLEKLKNISLLKKHIPTLRLGTVITRTLIDNFERYGALIQRIHPHSWELFRPMSLPRQSSSSITISDYRKLAIKIIALRKSSINVTLANAIPICILDDLRIAQEIMMGALSDDGHTRLVWDSRGFYKPSYFIDKNLGRTIKTAWDHAFLKKIRKGDFLPKVCRKCPYLKKCQGGSRAIARKTHHSYFAQDPFLPEKKTSNSNNNLH